MSFPMILSKNPTFVKRSECKKTREVDFYTSSFLLLSVLFQLLLLEQEFAVGDGKLVPDEMDWRCGQMPKRVRIERPEQRRKVQKLQQDCHVQKQNGEQAETDLEDERKKGPIIL